jgi:hypothetical protein
VFSVVRDSEFREQLAMAATLSSATAVVPPADGGFTNHGMRTLIATAPLKSAVLLELFQELKRPQTALTGLIVFVFASWCDCCQQFVDEYNRLVALVPSMCRTVIAWTPDSEILPLRALGAETGSSECNAIGHGIARLPAVFFVNTSGQVKRGTMYTSFEPILEEYLQFNESARAVVEKEFVPEIAAAALGVSKSA